MEATFLALKRVLARYAKRFSVTDDAPGAYTLSEEGASYRTLFGGVYTRKRDVMLVFYPLHVFRELAVPARLAAKQRTYALYFRPAITPGELAQVRRVLEAGWKLVQARRKQDATRSYHLPRKPR